MIKYWIIVNDQQKGPYTLDQLKEMTLSPQTPVWREGLVYWTRANDVDELAPWTLKEDDTPTDVITAAEPDVIAERPAVTAAESQQVIDDRRVIYVPEEEVPEGYEAITLNGKPKCPRSYLVLSIISTLLFFFPLGICAIFCSAKVVPHYQAGRFDKAFKMSERAQLFIALSIVCMLMWMPFYVVISMI